MGEATGSSYNGASIFLADQGGYPVRKTSLNGDAKIRCHASIRTHVVYESQPRLPPLLDFLDKILRLPLHPIQPPIRQHFQKPITEIHALLIASLEPVDAAIVRIDDALWR